MSSCNICLELFDHSIHKPYSLSSCPHTYCLSCLEKLTNNKCPQCDKLIKEKNPNIALLEFIPESSYDKLKKESFKALIEINETKQDLKNCRQETLKKHESKLILIKKVVTNETCKMIDVLKLNEQVLMNQCDKMLNELNTSLDSKKFEEKDSFKNIDESKIVIEKNKLNEEELKNLNCKINQIKQELNKLTDQVKTYQNNYTFNSNKKITMEDLVIGEIKQEKTTKVGVNKDKVFSNFLNKSMALYRSKKYEEALECINKVLELNPSHLDALNRKGSILHDLNKYDEALQCFNKVIELKPDNLDAYVCKGDTLQSLNKFLGAIECYNRVLSFNPDHLIAIHNKGLTLRNLDRNKEAIECFNKLLTIQPNESDHYYNKGISFKILKKYDEALQCYDKAIELNPKNSWACNNKGNILRELERYNEAIQCYDKAIEIDPNYSKPYNSKGTVLRETEKYEEAMKCYDKAIELEPNSFDAYFNKGQAFLCKNKFDEAIDCYNKVLEIKPNYTEAINYRNIALMKKINI